jgi:hypothetical protein
MPPPVTVPGPLTDTVRSAFPAGTPPNVAVTWSGPVAVSVHVVAVPLHALPHPEKGAPAVGFAVSVTRVPAASVREHPEPPAEVQSMPPTETVPAPVTVTASGKVEPVLLPAPVNAAVTVLEESMVTTHVGVEPAHAPPHAVNPAEAPGVAVRVTGAFAASFAEQVVPPADVQEMPPPVTVPLPLTETVNVVVVADCAKLALTLRSAFIVTEHEVAVPLQAPPQPPNV